MFYLDSESDDDENDDDLATELGEPGREKGDQEEMGDNTGVETGEEGDQENSDSDEDQWQIMEESDTEIDKTLEDRAQKNHLSARNVKSILHVNILIDLLWNRIRRSTKRWRIGPRKTTSPPAMLKASYM